MSHLLTNQDGISPPLRLRTQPAEHEPRQMPVIREADNGLHPWYLIRPVFQVEKLEQIDIPLYSNSFGIRTSLFH